MANKLTPRTLHRDDLGPDTLNVGESIELEYPSKSGADPHRIGEIEEVKEDRVLVKLPNSGGYRWFVFTRIGGEDGPHEVQVY